MPRRAFPGRMYNPQPHPSAMTSREIDRLLSALERARRRRGAQEGVERILSALASARFRDASRLLRFHEALLYFSAYPSRAAVLRRSSAILSTFTLRVEALTSLGGDLSPFEEPPGAGIAASLLTMAFSFDLLRWLDRRCRKVLKIVWDDQEGTERLASTLPRIVPLLEEESLAEANVPYLAWLDAARNASRESRIGWLLHRFEGLRVPPAVRAELFDSLSLSVEWRLGRSRWSRTRLRLPGGPRFFHRRALLSRSGIRPEEEIAGPRLRVSPLSPDEARRALEAARAALATRYRELHGFTHGETRGALRAEGGRGLRFFLFGLPPEHRLPIRGGYAALVARNGVPVAYGDGFALFERLDLSFNVFPEFRDGESAFLFAKLLKLYHQTLGVTVFSVDPYQIGFRNEEAIESGAFWFYRRLGFRPTTPALERLAQREEERRAGGRAYLSPPSVLRRLAGGNMLLDLRRPGRRDWDDFQIRRLGFAVGRRMAARLLSAEELRTSSAARVERLLRVHPTGWSEVRRRASADLTLVLDLLPGLPRWTPAERSLLGKIVEAKSAPSESRYVRLLQKHDRLRAEILRLGSSEPGPQE